MALGLHSEKDRIKICRSYEVMKTISSDIGHMYYL